MSKYVRCIESDLGVPLTEGFCYKILDSNRLSYLLEGDDGKRDYYRKARFEEPYDVQEPIIFLTQQDFEDAVMKTVMQRLSVFEWREGWKTHFGMEDSDEDG